MRSTTSRGQPDHVALEDRVVDEAEGRPDDDPVLDRLEHVERLLVGEVAVVDAVDAGAHGALDRFRRPAVAGDPLAPIMRELDAAVRLRSSLIEVISARACPTNSSPETLNLTLSTPSRQQRRTAVRISSVPSAIMPKLSAWHVLLALVAEAAGHGDLRAGRAIARAGEIAVLDLLADDDVDAQLGRGGGVAAGEAVIEDEGRVAAGAQQMLLRRDFAEVLVARADRRMRDGSGPRPCRASGTWPPPSMVSLALSRLIAWRPLATVLMRLPSTTTSPA